MTQEEFKDEVGRLRPKLLGVARRYVGDEDAEDVVQDVLLRLWQMLAELRLPIDALASVLTRNMAVSLLRRQPRPQPDASMMADEADAGDDERDEEIKECFQHFKERGEDRLLLIIFQLS